MNDVVVREWNPADSERWDEFVARCPEATFFHRIGWKRVIEEGAGHRGYYLLAERNGDILGILPLAHTRSLLFGSALVSLPFCVYGGVAAQEDSARQPLEQAACDLADRLGVDYLELRNRVQRRPDWPYKTVHAAFRREIDIDPDINLKAMKRKQRAVIRHSLKAGLKARIDSTIDDFFDTYSTSVRNLGTPVFGKKHFRLLKETFGDQCEILSITREEQPVSSLMSFYFRDEVLPYYGGGLPEARGLKAMDFMYWDLMCRSAEQGFHHFDFGRSKIDSGPYHYKRHWGFEPSPLFYEYHLVKARTVPDLSPLNPKYRLFIAAWKRMPLFMSQLIGPFVSKYVG